MEHYGTEADFAAYATSVGKTPAAGDVLPALVRASAYIDGTYGSRFPGQPTGGWEQELAWPRSGATSREGFAIPSDAVPRAVERATYEATFRELAAPGSLSPDYVAAAAVKREVVGPIETEYAISSNGGTAADVTPVIGIIDGILAGLLRRPMPAVLVV